jgi:hypothetical protein
MNDLFVNCHEPYRMTVAAWLEAESENTYVSTAYFLLLDLSRLLTFPKVEPQTSANR